MTSSVVYFAKMPYGDIIEADSLKSLYHAVLTAMRIEYGNHLFYDSGSVIIHKGVHIEWTENGVNHFKNVPVIDLMKILVSSSDRHTYCLIVDWRDK